MLIRIAAHYIDNPHHIDKMICIKGLPEDWIFKPSKHGGVELLPPWQPDVEENIPTHIRHLCDPREVTFVFPSMEQRGQFHVDKRTVIGLKFDYMTQAGQDLWDKIERFLETAVPRDQRIPKPVVVAASIRTGFDPHMARRSVRGGLEFVRADIPVIDVRVATPIAPPAATVSSTPAEATKVVVQQKPPVAEKKVEPVENLPCDECPKVFTKPKALKMHKIVAHKKKEPVGV